MVTPRLVPDVVVVGGEDEVAGLLDLAKIAVGICGYGSDDGGLHFGGHGAVGESQVECVDEGGGVSGQGQEGRDVDGGAGAIGFDRTAPIGKEVGDFVGADDCGVG